MSEINKFSQNDIGMLKVDEQWIVNYASKEAINIINGTKPIVGEKITQIIPNFIFPHEMNKPYCYTFYSATRELLITSILMEDLNESKFTIVLLQDLEHFFSKINSLTANFLFNVMNSEITITDGNGKILKVSPSYEKKYGIKPEEIIGKSVFELEKKGIFSPSATAMALKQKKRVSIIQHNKYGDQILVTAVPMFNHRNEIINVVNYDSWDITDYVELKEKYEKLKRLIKGYSAEVQQLRNKELQFPDIIAKSPQMQNVLKTVMKVCEVDTNVLITGDSGVGKNVIARLIHQHSARAKGPLIEINCGAIPESLIESELFGYEKGAFTGALHSGKIGQIELANDGTLFLDEIGELPLSMQVKLLKVIQERKIVKVGGTRQIPVNFRLISATNKNLQEEIKIGNFREDLYYRLSVIPIHIPPLKERPDDLLPLIMHFLDKANEKYQRDKTFSSSAIDALMNYDWPGNIRELQNLIERLVLTVDDDCIDIDSLPEHINLTPSINSAKELTLKKAMDLYEMQILRHAYKKYGSSVKVAEALGISQPTAARKLKRYVPSYSKKNN